MKRSVFNLVSLVILSGFSALSSENPQLDLETLRKEIDELKRDNAEIRQTNSTLVRKLSPLNDSAGLVLNSRYGPNAPVTSKTGKLQMNGLVQIWYYKFQ